MTSTSRSPAAPSSTARARRGVRGDVGIRDGRIVALGEATRRARGRRSTPTGRVVAPGLRRHPHPLRRAGAVGPHAHDLAVARRDHGRDGQLRLRRRAHAAGAPRADPAHAREGRGHEPRRAREPGSAKRVAVRDLPRVSRRRRAPRQRDQRGGASSATRRCGST